MFPLKILKRKIVCASVACAVLFTVVAPGFVRAGELFGLQTPFSDEEFTASDYEALIEAANVPGRFDRAALDMVDPGVQATLSEFGRARVIIRMGVPSLYEGITTRMSAVEVRTTVKSRLQYFGEAKKFVGVVLGDDGKLMRDLPIVSAVAAEIGEEALDRLLHDPVVKRIELEDVMAAKLMDSVPLVRAPQVWSLVDRTGAAVTGKGIKIAILDTGVDDTHLALAGRVLPGWDFVNNDDDADDDNGHGTHGAGIVAADGIVRGVAFESGIVPVKVLDQGGYGFESMIIDGLQYALDPNGDGDISDRVDVANLSLGGHGWPEDALSLAANQLSELGVVVVVAAGNNGPAVSSITSPGKAAKVITVAASCWPHQDYNCNTPITFFSARGPIIFNGIDLEKPDITAPGYWVCSTTLVSVSVQETGQACPGGYVRMSGTSMATPHVAGAVALLKQLYPDRTSEWYKLKLKNNARDLGESYESQGAGLLDLLAATEGYTLVYFPMVKIHSP